MRSSPKSVLSFGMDQSPDTSITPPTFPTAPRPSGAAPGPHVQAPPKPPPATVRLLGPVEICGHPIVGVDRPWKYTNTGELVVWLALHPNGGDHHRIMEALWPGQPADTNRLNQRASDARIKMLGCSDHIPKSATGSPWYQLVNVEVDLVQFARLINSQEGDRAANLTEALSLIGGRPFDRIPNEWLWADGDIAETEARIVETALELHTIALDRGTPRLGMFAASKGLLAVEQDQRLLTALGVAALASEDPGMIARVFQGLSQLEPDEITSQGRQVLVDLDDYRTRRSA